MIHIVGLSCQAARQGASAKYIMYDTFFGATRGMRMFKQKLGFKPYRVKWLP
jgi:hypothetical protein